MRLWEVLTKKNWREVPGFYRLLRHRSRITGGYSYTRRQALWIVLRGSHIQTLEKNKRGEWE